MRRIHHHHATRGGGFQIDIIDADAGTPDHLQPGRDIQHFLRDLGVGADGQAVIFADDVAQFGGRQTGLYIHLQPTIAENLDSRLRQLVADQNFFHDNYAAAWD